MDKITPRQIQMFVNTLSKDGANEQTGKALAPKTVKHYLSLISDIFGYGVKMGVVSENPCSKVTIPKVEQTEKQIYSPEQVGEFFKLLEDEPLKYRAFFKLAVYSGYRRGELLGLEWKDVDFTNNCYKHPPYLVLYNRQGNLYGHNKDEEVSALAEIPTGNNGLAPRTANRASRGTRKARRLLGRHRPLIHQRQRRAAAPEHYIHLAETLL